MKKLFLCLCLLFLLAGQGWAATFLGPSGFETGSNPPTEIWTIYAGSPLTQNSTYHIGSYALKLTGTNSQGITSTTGLNKSTVYGQVYFRMHVTSNPTGAQDFAVFRTRQAGPDLGMVRLLVTTGGACSLRLYNGVTSAAVGSDYSINVDTWYRLAMKEVIHATNGILEMMVNGVSQASGTGLNTGSTNVSYFQLVTSYTNGTIEAYFDDFIANDTGYPDPAPAGYPTNRRRFPF